jgi:signal transduction histidine kinase
MKSLRARILWSLLLVMSFSVAVTVGFCTHIVYPMMVDQTKNQLSLQLQKALSIIEEGDPNTLGTGDLPFRFKHRIFNADFYVIGPSGRIVAASEERLIGRKAGLHLMEEDGTAVLHGVRIMYAYGKTNGCTVFIYKPEEYVKNMFHEALKIVLVSMLVSSVLLLAVGFLVIWKITTPIAKLKEAVSQYEPYRSVLPLSRAGATEIDDLMATFQSMSERIHRHHGRQIEFLQNVSHELRTPLMSIQGYAIAIKDQVVPQEKGLGIIMDESYRLIRMVNRLLELTRLEAPFDTEAEQTVELGEMVRQAAELVSPNGAERGVRIAWFGPETTLSAPGEALFQLLINLIQNAVRYARSEVRVTYGPDQAGWFLAVDDDGEGVPEDWRERIFDRYFKGEGGGSGLGLSICRQIADTMRAQLRYEPSPLGGARFVLSPEAAAATA